MNAARVRLVLSLLLLAAASACIAGGFDVEQATRAYLATLPAADKARSDAYFEGGYWLQLINMLWSVGLAWLLMRSGLSVRMRSLGERITRKRPLADMLYGLQYVLLVALLSFPLGWYQEFWREHHYQLSNQTFGAWFGESLVALAVNLVVTAPLVALIWAAIRRSPKHWWLWGTAISSAFLAVMIALGPVFIAPLFNDYKPLADGPIKQEILSLARANGIPATEVWEFDASRQSKRISANVSGAFGTERISLNDNLLKRCSIEEIRDVMGHEMGHYVLNHINKDLVAFTLIILAGFAFMRWSVGALINRHGARWGVSGIGDVAVLPVALAAFSVFMLVMTPVTNTIIRTAEQEADMYGLNAAREPDGFATIALKLSEYRKMEPGPLEEMLFYDHPSGATRIRTAMRWKAEHLKPSENKPATP